MAASTDVEPGAGRIQPLPPLAVITKAVADLEAKLQSFRSQGPTFYLSGRVGGGDPLTLFFEWFLVVLRILHLPFANENTFVPPCWF